MKCFGPLFESSAGQRRGGRGEPCLRHGEGGDTSPREVNPGTTGRFLMASETSLYYYRARYYDSASSRFLSEDPITFSGGINFYAYVGNNPVIFLDLDGLSPLSYGQVMNLIAANNLSNLSSELIICIVYKESSFDPDAMRADYPKNTARGLMGVTQGSAGWVGYNWNNLGNAALNIQAGTKILNREVNWTHLGHGDVAWGLSHYGEGKAYANTILNCEKCVKKEETKCKDKEPMGKCLKPMNQ